MFRYLAILWNANRDDQSHVVTELRERATALRGDWRNLIEAPGVYIACAGENETGLSGQPLADRCGAVLGSLWRRPQDPLDDAPLERAKLDTRLSRAIVESDAQILVEEFWGNYVAMVRRDTQVTFLLSPTASLPCLCAAHRDVIVVLSCLSDAFALRLRFSSASWEYLRDCVLGRPVGARDPVHGLIRLLRGEALRLELAATRIVPRRQVRWRPLQFSRTRAPIEDTDRAARAICSTILACTSTLAASHPRSILRLSGGLDSTIVCSALGTAPSRPAVSCYTYYLPGSNTDTRPWARRAAAHAGYEITEVPVDSSALRLPDIAVLQPSADATARLRYLDRPQRERALAALHGATAVFTGDGGDSGFCSDSVAFALEEYWRLHPFGARTLHLASQIALTTHRSTWRVLTNSRRYLRHGVSTEELARSRLPVCQLVHADVCQHDTHRDWLEHPWFADCDRIPVAAIHRLGALVMPPEFYDLSVPPETFAPQTLHPLFSQPVVELMLRIPLHVHFDSGRDRGLARRAFAGLAPRENLERLWKDRAPGFMSDLIDRNADWVRETLLDGVLVSERLLDRAKVEAALSDAPSRSAVNPAEIVRHLYTELWARQWR